MRFWMALGVLFLCLPLAARGPGLDDRLADGEAYVWYLGHAGWLVRTSEHCLVFDYTGGLDKGDLSSGRISSDLLTGCNVLLFISHAHSDHFNPGVLRLRDTVADLTVVMGWEEPTAGAAVVPPDGRWTEVAGASVFALHHDFDGIPEGFFLVRSGGLTIYFSGDHGTLSDPLNQTFRENIDRIAAAANRVDIAFISSFGTRGNKGVLNKGDIYGIRTLRPRVTFPMHCGGCEDRYAAFAREASSAHLPTRVGVAKSPGAFFHYRASRR